MTSTLRNCAIRMRPWRVGLLVVGFCVSIVGAARSETLPSLLYRGARPMGMGNAFEAVANDMNAFEYNPAGLANYTRLKIDIVPVQARITSDLATELEGIQNLLDEIDAVVKTDPNQLLDSDAGNALVEHVRDIQRRNLKVHANLGVATVGLPLPVSPGGVRVALGASVSNQLLVGFRFQKKGLSWGNPVLDLLDDRFVAQTALDFVTLRFAGAAEKSLDIPYLRKVRGGLSYRIVQRRYKEDLFTLADMAADPKEFQKQHLNTKVKDGTIDSYADVREIIDNNTTKQNGFGADLGFQVQHTDYLTSALVFRNLASSVGDDEFPATTTLSVAARPLYALNIDNPLLDVLVAASLSKAAGDDFQVALKSGNTADNLHLGAEVTLFPKSPIRAAARIGNNQGFTTIGADVRFLFIEASVVRYGDLETDWWTGAVRLTF